MGSSFVIAGSERSEIARSLGQIQRNEKVKAAQKKHKEKIKQMTKIPKKCSNLNPEKSQELTQILMSEKMKIRK